jgi:hypothetical protein
MLFDAVMRILLKFVLVLLLAGCKSERPKTTLIYFGFDKHDETPEDMLRLSRQFGERPICPQWRPTLNREDADYQVLFQNPYVTIVDRRGHIIYSSSLDVLSSPSGNSDRNGINLCKLTGEEDTALTGAKPVS